MENIKETIQHKLWIYDRKKILVGSKIAYQQYMTMIQSFI